MARRDKLTPKREEAILTAIRQGLTYERACQAAGIHPATYRNWKERGKVAKSGKFFAFFAKATRAEAEGEQNLLQNILEAGQDPRYWQANLAILERRHPERWSKTQKHQIDMRSLTDEQLERVASGEHISTILATTSNSGD